MSNRIIYSTLFFVSCAMISCKTEGDKAASSEINNRSTPVVEVEHPQMLEMQSVVEITGSLEPLQYSKVYAPEGGLVEEVRVDIGDEVKKGQVIAVLANPELQQNLAIAEANAKSVEAELLTAEAGIPKAESSLKVSESRYKRLSEVYHETPNLVTIDDLDNAQAAVEMARADLEVARIQPQILKAQHASALAQSSAVKERVAMLTVKAPFSGGVSRRYIHAGGVLQSAINGASEPIIEIVQANTLRLVVNYPESDLARVHVGTKVLVDFPEIAGYEMDAEISRVAAALNTGSKTLRAEIDIDNTEGRLKPGMYAKVQTMQKTSAAVMTINTMAITAVKNQNYIYKVEDGVVRRIPVTLGLEDKYRIEVFSADLDSDDLVIVKGKTLVNEGMSVQTKLADD